MTFAYTSHTSVHTYPVSPKLVKGLKTPDSELLHILKNILFCINMSCSLQCLTVRYGNYKIVCYVNLKNMCCNVCRYTFAD